MPSFAFKCVYFRNRKQTSSIALHCFWASFSRQSNEPRDSTHFDSILLILNLRHSSLRWDSLIVTQFHFEANSGFGEPTANGDSCIWRVWWLGWCTEEEDHGSGISLWCSFVILTWLIVLLIHPHHHRPHDNLRVPCKNVELIIMLQRLHICRFVSCQWVTYSEGRCNWVFGMRDGVTGDLDSWSWLMTTLLWSLLPTKLRCHLIGSRRASVWFIPDSLCI